MESDIRREIINTIQQIPEERLQDLKDMVDSFSKHRIAYSVMAGLNSKYQGKDRRGIFSFDVFEEDMKTILNGGYIITEKYGERKIVLLDKKEIYMRFDRWYSDSKSFESDFFYHYSTEILFGFIINFISYTIPKGINSYSLYITGLKNGKINLNGKNINADFDFDWDEILKPLTLKEVIELFKEYEIDITENSIRYYDQTGLLPTYKRPGKKKIYSPKAIGRLFRIDAMKREGKRFSEIKNIFATHSETL